ncbi:hypothetical protein PMZ80_004468 [Knufia obscura]|uniref:Uncharacterized protein n=2 Tax=Knufia TaxID=430999 RepID=A0AAN8EBQ8_9EURO|nr:hypothetical protein PMZ80_004468 [Knufia obscura]KAK5951654.1 hypothetical protein OHC33_007333 [Knufia fluminis]
MSKAGGDPYYDRKRVPDEFVDGVGYSGLTPAEEITNRERKYSRGGGDVRHFWTAKSKDGKMDPYYQRKPIPAAMIHNVGETGLTREKEFLNRERKYSVNGADVRRFSDSTKSGFHPTDDPYYGRKPVNKTQLDGVGDIQMSAAEVYEQRDNKTAFAEFSGDPFKQLTGQGHRQSVSGIAGPAAAAAARRRSSAVAPDAVVATHHHHSGYDGDNRLNTVESRATDEITPTPSSAGGYGTAGNTLLTSNPNATYSGPSTISTGTATTSTAVRDDTGHHTGPTGHTVFYDAATQGLDNIAPHERL